MKQLVLIFLIVSAVYAEKARYDFYRVYQISINEEIHLELMQQISEYPDGVRIEIKFKA